ncbi:MULTISPECIES: hypothetical protein [unclassified Yoonia]|uniref:hypothetical protein n=1 Tax=unclassified Yoonia TaxID=2629118 RepID=UPI002AFECCC0|nr:MULTISPECIES: hypothetical protein [unclassified Yoonia]
MSHPVLTGSHLRAGIWEFGVTSTARPDLTATHEGQPLPDLRCAPGDAPDRWLCSLPVPSAILNEGLQTIVIRSTDGTTIGSLAILSGEALAEDIRAEIDLLRCELDLLKAAFRQQHHAGKP